MTRLIALLLLLPALALAQPYYNTGSSQAPLLGAKGTTLPATCTVGQLYFKTDATAGYNIYECASTDTWTQQGAGGGAGTVTATAGALTANAVMLGAGTTDSKVMASLGTTTTVLHGNASGAPTFGAVSLTADVSGVLPVANGGTNNAYFTVSGPATSAKTYTFPNASASMTITVASGAKALATGAIASAACTAAQTDTATGTATTDTIIATFNGDPIAVTGYVPLTTGMLTIIPYPTADTVNFKVCNNTAASITPGAITLNWRVVR